MISNVVINRYMICGNALFLMRENDGRCLVLHRTNIINVVHKEHPGSSRDATRR